MIKELPLVRLRALEPEDLDLLYTIENDTSLWNVSNINVPYSRYVLSEYIARSTADIYADKQVRLMAENEDGAVVGIADIVDFAPEYRRAELGLVIRSEYRGRGYGRAVVGQVVSYARKVLHLHQLYVYIACDNTVSAHLFSEMGFHMDVRLRDWIVDGDGYKDVWCMQLFL